MPVRSFATNSRHKPLACRKRWAPLLTLLVLCACTMYGADSRVLAEEPPAAAKTDATEVLTLDDVQDVAIILRQIRQESINIYEEASRVRVPLDGKPELPDIHSIPCKIADSQVLPARQEWLVWYVGTMEPVIRQLGHHVSDIEKGLKQIVVPAALQQSLDPIWDAWSKNVQKMNDHLSELVPLIDDAPHNNEKIRQVAVAMFDDVNELESVRRSIFRVIQQSAKEHPDAKIMISPP